MFSKTIAAALLLATAPAGAADTDGKPAAKAAKSRMICRTEQEIGSRLARKRICMTRAQREDLHQENRMSLDKATAIRPTSGN